MDVRKCAFNAPSDSRLSLKESLKLPKKNLSSKATCGLRYLYNKDLTQQSRESASCTDKDGHFVPRKGLVLSDRYICQSRIERKGQSAVLINAQDVFQSRALVAIKVMHVSYMDVGLKEVDTLRRLNMADPGHVSHTVRLLNAFMYDGHVCLVFPLYNPQPLSRVIADWNLKTPQKLNAIRKIAFHLLSSLAFLKRNNTLHTDIKPENVLVDMSSPAKGENILDSLVLVDLGNAIHHTHTEVSLYYSDFDLQTLPYRAPEVCIGIPFGVEIDMWSLGCLLLELFLGKMVFPGTTRTSVLKGMTKLLGSLPEVMCRRGKFGMEAEVMALAQTGSRGQKMSPFDLTSRFPSLDYDFASFLSGLLCYCPDERLTPWQALQHPFMAKEICIPYFLQDQTMDEHCLVAKSDYSFSQRISSDVKRMCPSTYDLLKSGTGHMTELCNISKNVARVQPLERSTEIRKEEISSLSYGIQAKSSSALKDARSSVECKKLINSTFAIREPRVNLKPVTSASDSAKSTNGNVFEMATRNTIKVTDKAHLQNIVLFKPWFKTDLPGVKPVITSPSIANEDRMKICFNEEKETATAFSDSAIEKGLNERRKRLQCVKENRGVLGLPYKGEIVLSYCDEDEEKSKNPLHFDAKQSQEINCVKQRKDEVKEDVMNSTFTISEGTVGMCNNFNAVSQKKNLDQSDEMERNNAMDSPYLVCSRNLESVQQSYSISNLHLNETFSKGCVKDSFNHGHFRRKSHEKFKQVIGDEISVGEHKKYECNSNVFKKNMDIAVTKSCEKGTEVNAVPCSSGNKNEMNYDQIEEHHPSGNKTNVHNSQRFVGSQCKNGKQKNCNRVKVLGSDIKESGKRFEHMFCIKNKDHHCLSEGADVTHTIIISNNKTKQEPRKSFKDNRYCKKSNDVVSEDVNICDHQDSYKTLSLVKSKEKERGISLKKESYYSVDACNPGSVSQTPFGNLDDVEHLHKSKSSTHTECTINYIGYSHEKITGEDFHHEYYHKSQHSTKKRKVDDCPNAHIVKQIDQCMKNSQQKKKLKNISKIKESTLCGANNGVNDIKQCEDDEKLKITDDIDFGQNESRLQSFRDVQRQRNKRLPKHTKHKSKVVRRELHFKSMSETFSDSLKYDSKGGPELSGFHQEQMVHASGDSAQNKIEPEQRRKRLLRESLLKDESDPAISDPYEFKVTPKEKRKKMNEMNWNKTGRYCRRKSLNLKGKRKSDGIEIQKADLCATTTIGDLVQKKIKHLRIKRESDLPFVCTSDKFRDHQSPLLKTISAFEDTTDKNNTILQNPASETVRQDFSDHEFKTLRGYDSKSKVMGQSKELDCECRYPDVKEDCLVNSKQSALYHSTYLNQINDEKHKPSPTINNEKRKLSPTINNEKCKPSHRISNEKRKLLPTINNEKPKLSSTINNKKPKLSSAINNEKRKLSPINLNATSNVYLSEKHGIPHQEVKDSTQCLVPESDAGMISNHPKQNHQHQHHNLHSHLRPFLSVTKPELGLSVVDNVVYPSQNNEDEDDDYDDDICLLD